MEMKTGRSVLLIDVEGRKPLLWHLDELCGRAQFVNVWCQLCREHKRKLHCSGGLSGVGTIWSMERTWVVHKVGYGGVDILVGGRYMGTGCLGIVKGLIQCLLGFDVDVLGDGGM